MITNIGRTWYTLFMLFQRNGWKKAAFLKKHGILHSIGENCYYHPMKLPAEPHLVSFGDNVFVGTGVSFITHNMVHCVFRNIPEFKDRLPDGKAIPWVDKIDVGNNVFIGANAAILYGVTIGSNCFIAANAVVTDDVEDNAVVAGCPAKKIGTFEGLFSKYLNYLNEFPAKDHSGLSLWEREERYFWNKREQP